MNKPNWDTIIVGQGLAGTTLAWLLIEAGQRVLIIDAGEPVSASRITPGLITPITGRRLVPVPGHDEMQAAAETYYMRIGARIGRTLYRRHPAIRLFANADQQLEWARGKHDPAVQPHLLLPQPQPLLIDGIADTTHGGFAMHGAQVDVAAYLDASRAHIAVETAKLGWADDVVFDRDVITVRGHSARRVISCEGFGAMHNPYFAKLPFQHAKGEILSLRFTTAMPRLSLHRGLWLAPTTEPDVFRAGSTSNWTTLDHVPTEAGRAEIETKLRAFIRVPYEVVDHRAAVRPIIRGRTPRMGTHPAQPQLGFFNGLATKGVIRAPWYARLLADHLLHGTPLPDSCEIRSIV